MVETNIQTLPKAELAQGVSPLVNMAMQGNVNTDQLRDILAIQNEWEANEARKAFHKALASAKAEMPVARKSGKNTHLNSTYATLDDLLAVANPVLANHGLSVSWRTSQTDGNVSATCIITHESGHSETSDPVAVPVGSGNKAVNPAQMVGIAMTYAKRYSFSNSLGMATEDSDGAGLAQEKGKTEPPRKSYTDEQFQKQMKGWIAKVESGELTAGRIITQVSNHVRLTESQHDKIATLREYTPVKNNAE